MALLLTGLTGTVWTEDQLMGTEEEAKATQLNEAEEKIAALQEKMKKAGIRG